MLLATVFLSLTNRIHIGKLIGYFDLSFPYFFFYKNQVLQTTFG